MQSDFVGRRRSARDPPNWAEASQSGGNRKGEDRMKDLEDARAAIIAVIEEETNAYLRRDYDAWEACWHDGPEIRRIHSHAGTGVTLVEGSEVREQMRRVLTNHTEWIASEAIQRENLNVVISAEMAWVTYDQIGDMSGTLGEMAGHYHELKILHKVAGFWKIACIVGHQIRIDHVTAPLVEVDESARLLWMNEAAQDRLPHHPKLGLHGKMLRANNPDAHAELLDAVAWIAEIKDRHTPCVGAEAVTRAIALGQDDTGLAHICWAILKDGKLLITFDDKERINQLLASAAEVYGLSKTQKKLACQVIEGRDLSAAARELRISPNTAKTHLQRIYDKTGVRTQPALVRVLLSADRRGV
jgi:DNA-binding CsgD family transcriptional regulator